MLSFGPIMKECFVVFIIVQIFAKFGRNQCSSFNNMKVLIFCAFGLKMAIHGSKLGISGWQCQRDPKTILMVVTTCLSH